MAGDDNAGSEAGITDDDEDAEEDYGDADRGSSGYRSAEWGNDYSTDEECQDEEEDGSEGSDNGSSMAADMGCRAGVAGQQAAETIRGLSVAA